MPDVMTVGQLRELIADLDDSAEVQAFSERMDSFTDFTISVRSGKVVIFTEN